MNCPTCQIPVQAGATKCSNCGTPLMFEPPLTGPTGAQGRRPVPYSGPRRNSNLAVASVILAGLSWFGFGPLTAVPAVITGHMAKKEILNSNGALGGEGLATAGLVVGYVTIGLTILLFGVWMRMMQSIFA
jgi:uncharacterized protein DUF4190